MKNNKKGSFKNRIKGFYIEPGKFKKNRFQKDEEPQEYKDLQNPEEDDLS